MASMNLTPEEREVLANALVEHAESCCLVDDQEYKLTKKLQKRLENFDKLSNRNRWAGIESQLKIQDKLNFFKGYTGKSYEELRYGESVVKDCLNDSSGE